MNDYIIGGGLSGLISGFYNDSYKIIDNFKRDQLQFSKGPLYFWDTSDTRKFLSELNVDITDDVLKIGYLTDDSDKAVTYCSLEDRLKYFKKSRVLPTLFCPTEHSMSEQKTQIDILTVNIDDVTTKLITHLKDRLVDGRVDKLNFLTNNLRLSNSDKWIPFDNVISTIPAPEFKKLIVSKKFEQLEHQFYWASKLFEQTYTTRNAFLQLDDYIGFDYHILYDCRQSSLVSRYTRDGLYCIHEYNFDRLQYPLMSSLVSKTDNYLLSYYGQIQSDVDVKDIEDENIHFIGRYAKWKHGIKLHHIISDAKKLN